jgi:hypothetical protein
VIDTFQSLSSRTPQAFTETPFTHCFPAIASVSEVSTLYQKRYENYQIHVNHREPRPCM